MKHKNIPVLEIVVPETRVTAVYDDELSDQLSESIGALGQLQPIVVVDRGDHFELVDGLHRLIEAKNRGEKTIPSVVYEGDGAQPLILNLVTNRLRGKTKASEMVEVITELVNTHGLDSVQIAERTGLPRDYVERLWRIGEASQEVQDALDAEAIGVTAAHELARLPNYAQQDEFLKIYTVYKMTAKDIKAKVDEVLAYMAEPAPVTQSEPTAPPPPPSCEGCSGTPPPNMLTAVVLCPNCFGHVYRTHQPAEPTMSGNGKVEAEAGTG